MVVTIHNNPITVWGLKNGERLNWQSESNATQQRSASVQIDVLPVCQSPCAEITWKKNKKTKRDNNYWRCQLFCCTVKQQNVFLFHQWTPQIHFFFYYLLRLSESVHWRWLFVMSQGAPTPVGPNYFNWHVRGPTKHRCQQEQQNKTKQNTSKTVFSSRRL